MESGYFLQLCSRLPEAIQTDDRGAILSLTGQLLSDLTDRGWVMSALWRWHYLFIKEDSGYSFEQNLEFMLNQFKREPQWFTVTLRMQGGKEFASATEFEGFSFTQNPGKTGHTPQQRSFFKQNSLRYFATTRVESNDDISAAMLAREKLESVLDVFRFEFSAQQPFLIWDTAYVVREGDKKIHLPEIRREVPNPQKKISYEEFQEFANSLNHIREKSLIHHHDRRQFDAALRQYRFGRDGEGHKDKLMNWWMGLEDLCPQDSTLGGIGPSVIHYASRVLAVNYLRRILGDFVTTIKHCAINWPEKLAQESGCETLDKLCVKSLLKILQTPDLEQELWSAFDDQLLVYRGAKIAKIVSSPKNTHDYICRHQRHLEWHLARIYRIRCCVVHGSEIRMKLDLITANQEYFLKELFRSMVLVFDGHGHVASLLEFFKRAELAWDRQVRILSDESASKEAVCTSVFMELVQREHH